MATEKQSPTALARQTAEELKLLSKDVEQLEKEIVSGGIPDLRNRVVILQEHVRLMEEALKELKEYPVLQKRVSDLEDHKKLTDSRFFQFVMLFIGGIITLAIQVLILFFKK